MSIKYLFIIVIFLSCSKFTKTGVYCSELLKINKFVLALPQNNELGLSLKNNFKTTYIDNDSYDDFRNCFDNKMIKPFLIKQKDSLLRNNYNFEYYILTINNISLSNDTLIFDIIGELNLKIKERSLYYFDSQKNFIRKEHSGFIY